MEGIFGLVGVYFGFFGGSVVWWSFRGVRGVVVLVVGLVLMVFR